MELRNVDKEPEQRNLCRSLSLAQRVALTTGVALGVAVAWWLLLGGVATAAQSLDRNWTPGDPDRRICLGFPLSNYFVRLLFTQFVFLKRVISWSEAAMIAIWVFVLCLWLTLAAGTSPSHFGVAAIFGITLFLIGSWTNS